MIGSVTWARRLAMLLSVGVFGVLTSTTVSAQSFGEVILSSEKNAEESEKSFESDTPRLYVSAELVDVPSGAKVTSAWIAISAKGAPANYVIDTATVTVGSKANVANFNISKPNAGWPVGTYRVDLSINGSVKKTVRFKIES